MQTPARTVRCQWALSVVGILAAAVLGLWSAPAYAQGDVSEAREHFQQGEAYFKAGAYREAAEEYKRAYDLVPKAVLLFNIGLAYEKGGDARLAVEHYRRYLDSEPNGNRAQEARARMAALADAVREAEQAEESQKRSLELRQEAQAQRAAGKSQVAIDKLNEAYRLDPQPDIIFEIAEIYFARGERSPALTEYRRYVADAGATTHRDRALRRIEELERTPTGPKQERPGERSFSVVPAAVALGVGVVFLGTGIGLGLGAKNERSDLDSALDSGVPPLDSNDPRFDSGEKKARIANVMFGMAGVAVVGGAVLGYLWFKDREQAPAARVQPAVSARGAGLLVEVAW